MRNLGLVVGEVEVEPGGRRVSLGGAEGTASWSLPNNGVNVAQLVQDLRDLASQFNGFLENGPTELDSVAIGLTIGTDGLLKLVGVNAQGSITLTFARRQGRI